MRQRQFSRLPCTSFNRNPFISWHTTKFLRDDKLHDNDVLADEIVNQFARAAVRMFILTPRHLNSDLCRGKPASFVCAQFRRE